MKFVFIFFNDYQAITEAVIYFKGFICYLFLFSELKIIIELSLNFLLFVLNLLIDEVNHLFIQLKKKYFKRNTQDLHFVTLTFNNKFSKD